MKSNQQKCLGLIGFSTTIFIISLTVALSQNTSTHQQAIENAGWADNVSISIQDEAFVFSSDGLPSHGYLDAYLAKGANGFSLGDDVQAYDAEFTIPLNPVLADAPTETGFGAIGVAISGAVFFNAFEGGADADIYAVEDNAMVDGVPFIDACNGHPLPQGLSYHYHGIPYCISDAIDGEGEHSKIAGFLLDGFPVYGPQDANGNAATDLDECNGHFGVTPEFPEAIYHYHTTETAPYIANCYMGEVSVQARPGGQRGDAVPAGLDARNGLDLTAAAQELGISVEQLRTALGQGRPDLEAAAKSLGMSTQSLMAVLPPPPQASN